MLKAAAGLRINKDTPPEPSDESSDEQKKAAVADTFVEPLTIALLARRQISVAATAPVRGAEAMVCGGLRRMRMAEGEGRRTYERKGYGREKMRAWRGA